MPIPFTCPHCGAHFDVAEQYAGQTGPCAQCGGTIAVPASPFAAAPASAAGTAPPPRSGGFGAVAAVLGIVLVAGLCLAGLIVALVVPVYRTAQTTVQMSASNANLQTIGLALHAYHNANGCFPPAYLADAGGQPMHTWRVLLLPYLNETALYQAYDFNEPWNGPNNSLLVSRMPFVYGSPNATSTAPVGQTRFAVVSGPGCAFEGAQPRTMNDMQDGLGNIIFVVEAAAPIHWMKPVDVDYSTMGFTVNGPAPVGGNGIGGESSSGAFALLGDTSVHFLPADLFEETVKALLTRNGGEMVAVP